MVHAPAIPMQRSHQVSRRNQTNQGCKRNVPCRSLQLWTQFPNVCRHKIYSGSPLICSNDSQLSQSGPKEFNFVFFLSWKNLPLKRRLMIWVPLKKDWWDGYFLLLVTFLLTCCRLFFLWRTWARSTCVKQNGSWFTHVNHLICKKKLLRVYVRVLWIEQRPVEFLLATRPWKGVLKYLISFSRQRGRRKFNMAFAHFMALWHALKKISSFITRVLRVPNIVCYNHWFESREENYCALYTNESIIPSLRTGITVFVLNK